jgi:predicted transcriptional regulator
MDVLWDKGPATVQQVLDGLSDSVPLAYNSVLTTMRILERKRYVRHVRDDGRAHVYAPVVGRREASRFEVTHLLKRFFRNSHELLVLNLIEDESIDKDELKRLRDLLQKRK